MSPIGAFIDATRHKRALLIGGVWALAAAPSRSLGSPTMPVVLAADIVMAVLGAVFAPTVAAITVGLVAAQQPCGPASAAMPPVTGRATSSPPPLAGLAGWAFTIEAVFYLDSAVRRR